LGTGVDGRVGVEEGIPEGGLVGRVVEVQAQGVHGGGVLDNHVLVLLVGSESGSLADGARGGGCCGDNVGVAGTGGGVGRDGNRRDRSGRTLGGEGDRLESRRETELAGDVLSLDQVLGVGVLGREGGKDGADKLHLVCVLRVRVLKVVLVLEVMANPEDVSESIECR
jgi:hypothetical protein